MDQFETIQLVLQKADRRLDNKGFKSYRDNVKVYGNYLRVFYQSKPLVDTGVSDDDMIYGIGIFLVNMKTFEFHSVDAVELIEPEADRLNANKR